MSAEFDVFISYRRSDGGRSAQLLRRLLQDYRPPRPLRARAAKYLKVYLDRIYERGTNDFFEGTILPALLSSRNLLILLTPDAADRPVGVTDWMRREFEAFEEGPHAGNVIAVLAEGARDDRRPSLLLKRYPHVEIIDMRGLGAFAFLHHDRAKRLADETVKLVAPLLGFGTGDMPALRREEERRRQSRLGQIAGASAALVVASAALSIYAVVSSHRVTDALSRSLTAAAQIIDAAAASMARGEARSRLLITSCDLLDSLRAEAGRWPSSSSLATCAQERSLVRDQLGERAEAASILTEAARLVRARFADTGKADDGSALIQADIAMLQHEASDAHAPDLSAAIATFVTEARRIVEALADDASPPRTAAKALRSLAITLGTAANYTAALRAADGSISLRQISIDRRQTDYETDMVESAEAYTLKAVLCQAGKDMPGHTDALARAKSVLDAIPPRALDDAEIRKRVDAARGMLARASSSPSR